MATYVAQIDRIVADTPKRIEAVVKQSSQELIRRMQTPVAQGGHMPVQTGFLRNSLVTQVQGGAALRGANAYVLAIQGYKIGRTLTSGWTAKYARHVNYGARGREGRHFIGNNITQWKKIVEKNVERLRKVRGL